MAQVSQKKISEKTLKRVTEQFFDSISKQKGFKTRSFLENILTDTEELMLSKRLATVLMLIDNTSYYKIGKILKISTSTSKRLHKKLLDGDYVDIEKWFRRKKNRDTFHFSIETIIRAGMPELGRNRWRFLDDYLGR